jgi:hypothetical protein
MQSFETVKQFLLLTSWIFVEIENVPFLTFIHILFSKVDGLIFPSFLATFRAPADTSVV